MSLLLLQLSLDPPRLLFCAPEPLDSQVSSSAEAASDWHSEESGRLDEVEEEEEEEDEGRRGLVHYRLQTEGPVGGAMSGRKEVERAEWEGAEEWQGEAAGGWTSS